MPQPDKATIEALRGQMQNLVPEPLDPVAEFYSRPEPAQSVPVPQLVPTGGYPIDYGWEPEANHYQSMSGEGPQ